MNLGLDLVAAAFEEVFDRSVQRRLAIGAGRKFAAFAHRRLIRKRNLRCCKPPSGMSRPSGIMLAATRRPATRRICLIRSERAERSAGDARATVDQGGTAARRRRCPAAASRSGPGADPGAGLRRLPHRPARGRRRVARPETAADPRPRDRRHGGRARATASTGLRLATRVGVPWLGWTCGVCEYCRGGQENLCDRARFTGYQIDGGYAEFAVADQRYCFAAAAEASTMSRRRRCCAPG